MISINGKAIPNLSFRENEKHPLMVTYKWDGELEILFCASPLSRNIYDCIKEAIKTRTEDAGQVTDLQVWCKIPTNNLE